MSQIEQWERFEVALDGPTDGNPFTEVQFRAQFRHGNRVIRAIAYES